MIYVEWESWFISGGGGGGGGGALPYQTSQARVHLLYNSESPFSVETPRQGTRFWKKFQNRHPNSPWLSRTDQTILTTSPVNENSELRHIFDLTSGCYHT